MGKLVRGLYQSVPVTVKNNAAHFRKGAPVIMVMESTDKNRPGSAVSEIADSKFRIINTSSSKGIGASLIMDQPPYEWLACTADEDCVATSFACQNVAVNKAHEHAFEETAAQMGFRIDPSVCIKIGSSPAVRNSTLIPKCLKDVGTGLIVRTSAANAKPAPSPRCVLSRRKGGESGVGGLRFSLPPGATIQPAPSGQ